MRQKGQALLLVLLSMAVVLTIVLSVLSRSITDIAVTSRDEEALRAFSAAEAGVEQALVAGGGSGTVGNASFNANVSGFASGSKAFVNPEGLYSGESMIAWFAAHDANGNLVCSAEFPCFTGQNLKVCWGKAGTPATDATTPALEVSVLYLTTPGDYSTIRIARVALDPNSNRTATNKFSAPDAGTCTISGTNFQFQKTIDLATLGVPAGSYGVENGLQFARFRFLYNTDTIHQAGIDVNLPGNSLLPSQGLKIDSAGTSGESNRKIEVFQSYGEVPLSFSGSVFSTGDIVK